MTIYLYVKTHLVTGLKYLGKTEKDPHQYKGSGKYWKEHVRVHGYDVKTDILLVTESHDELVETGLFFSKLFNVVESSAWANLIPESGEGVSGLRHSDKAKAKMSEVHKGIPRTKETKAKISRSLKHKPLAEEHLRKLKEPHTEEHKVKISESLKGAIFTKEHRKKLKQKALNRPKVKCERCGKQIAPHVFSRWHGNKCKVGQ
jgi:hypothetical protein